MVFVDGLYKEEAEDEEDEENTTEEDGGGGGGGGGGGFGIACGGPAMDTIPEVETKEGWWCIIFVEETM